MVNSDKAGVYTESKTSAPVVHLQGVISKPRAGESDLGFFERECRDSHSSTGCDYLLGSRSGLSEYYLMAIVAAATTTAFT